MYNGGGGGVTGIHAERPANLPPPWQMGIDPASGKCYYYNVQTNQTQWEFPKPTGPPAGLGAPGMNGNGNGHAMNGSSGGGGYGGGAGGAKMGSAGGALLKQLLAQGYSMQEVLKLAQSSPALMAQLSR